MIDTPWPSFRSPLGKLLNWAPTHCRHAGGRAITKFESVRLKIKVAVFTVLGAHYLGPKAGIIGLVESLNPLSYLVVL